MAFDIGGSRATRVDLALAIADGFNGRYGDCWPAIVARGVVANGRYPERTDVFISADVRARLGVDVSLFFGAEAADRDAVLEQLYRYAAQAFGDRVALRKRRGGNCISVEIAEPDDSSATQELVSRAAEDLSFLLNIAAETVFRSLEDRSFPNPIDTGELNEIAEAPEGRALTVSHLRHERSRALARVRKDRTLRTAGRLACEACGFDYAERYGERGHGFIECHHTRPVSELGNGAVTRLEDLALVCASCHRMIHARRPWLGMDELRAMVGSKRG